jgi:hypothetical protein
MKQKVLFTMLAIVLAVGICGIVYAETPDLALFTPLTEAQGQHATAQYVIRVHRVLILMVRLI